MHIDKFLLLYFFISLGSAWAVRGSRLNTKSEKEVLEKGYQDLVNCLQSENARVGSEWSECWWKEGGWSECSSGNSFQIVWQLIIIKGSSLYELGRVECCDDDVSTILPWSFSILVKPSEPEDSDKMVGTSALQCSTWSPGQPLARLTAEECNELLKYLHTKSVATFYASNSTIDIETPYEVMPFIHIITLQHLQQFLQLKNLFNSDILDEIQMILLINSSAESVNPANLNKTIDILVQYAVKHGVTNFSVRYLPFAKMTMNTSCNNTYNAIQIPNIHNLIKIWYIFIGVYIRVMYIQVRNTRSTAQIILKECGKLSPITDYWIDKRENLVIDGADYKTMKLFEQSHGLKRIKSISSSRTESSNTLRCIENGTADVVFNTFYLTSHRYKTVDFTSPISQCPLCIAVRKAPKIPFSLVLLLPYKSGSWLAIVMSLVAATFCWAATHQFCIIPRGDSEKRSAWRRGFEEVGRSILDITQTVISSGCSRRTRTSSERIVLAALLLFSLVLCNAYTGQLLGFLATRPYYTDPNTLEETEQNIERLYTFSDFRHILDTPESSPVMDRLGQKLDVESYDEMNRRLQEVSQKGEDGYLIGTDLYDVLARQKNLTQHGEIMFHLVPECVIYPGHVSFMVRKNMPHYDLLNQFVLRVVQSGLYTHAIQAQREHMIAHGWLVHDGIVSSGGKSLTINQLEGIFKLLAFGLACASVVFVTEQAVRSLDTFRAFFRHMVAATYSYSHYYGQNLNEF